MRRPHAGPFPANLLSPAARSPIRRRARLALALLRRARADGFRRLILFSAWTWVAAGSLVGFEALEIVFGGFALMPELVPVLLAVLALAWFVRSRLRRARVRARTGARARRRQNNVRI